MSQRYRRQQRRWAARLDIYYRYFVKEATKWDRKVSGYLDGPDMDWCGAYHHELAHKKLIHKGGKP